MAALRESKRALRKHIRQVLDNLSPESVDIQSRKATETLFGLKEYRDAGRVAVYLSMDGKEISTRQVVLDALDNGKKVFVPYLYKSKRKIHSSQPSIMDMMAINSKAEYDGLEKDSWGIPSLPSQRMESRENWLGTSGLPCTQEDEDVMRGESHGGLDLIVVPGVAFDDDLGRIGHGKGYYDRFITRCANVETDSTSRAAKPALVAFALEEQILPKGEEVPKDIDDWRMDAVVVGSGEVLR